MNNASPWRDVYSVAAWNTIRTTCIARPGHEKSVDDLARLLLEYHQIPKDDVASLPLRRTKLAAIEVAARGYLAHPDVVIKDARKVRLGKNVGGKQLVSGKRIDPWVSSLAGLCVKKSAYLDLLTQFYSTNAAKPAKKGPGDFQTWLLDKMNKVTQARQPGFAGPIQLVPGVRVEKYDPLHRAMELHYDAAHQTLESNNQLSMEEYFVEWLYGGKTGEPFWMWFETQPPCTDAARFEKGRTPGKTQVQYGPGAITYWEVMPQAGQLVGTLVSAQAPPQSVFTTRPFNGPKALLMDQNAAAMGGAAGDGGCAYVWSMNNDVIYAGQHSSGQFHHSSFTGGDKVQCAGMWQVNAAGKVTCLNADSGHYQPSQTQLRRFAEHLSNHNVLEANARVFMHGSSLPFAQWPLASAFITGTPIP